MSASSSYITQGQQGVAAVESKKWEEGISKLSTALQASSNPLWLVARSKALMGVQRYPEALADAELAWHKAYQRSHRQNMTEAQYRRAVAHLRLGQYANADCCCMYAMRLAKGKPAVEKPDPREQFVDENGFWMPTLEDVKLEAKSDPSNQPSSSMHADASGNGNPASRSWRLASALRTQILFAMQKLPADDPARKVTISIKPEERGLADLRPDGAQATNVKGKKTPTQPQHLSAPKPTAKPVATKDTPLAIQEFQSNTTMSVSIFSKGVDREKLQAEYSTNSVRFDPIVYPNGEEGSLKLELWGEIEPSACKHVVTPNKVELSLAKKTSGKWKLLFNETKRTALTKAAQDGINSSTSSSTTKATTTSSSDSTTAPPASAAPEVKQSQTSSPSVETSYPTSSKSGPRNWEKIADDNDNSDDDGEGKDVNSFFKKLFKNATPEQQRAMMKSFTESNGTSLSTDWNDVKDRVVKTSPPDGMEAKKWEK